MKPILIGLTALLLAGSAHATTYTLNTDGGGGLGTAPFGTVKTSSVGGNLNVTVNVSPNFDIDTGAHFALTFDLATKGLTIGGLSSPFFQEAGSSFVNAPFNATKFDYAIGCSGGGKGMNSCNDATGFTFKILGAGALSPILTDGVYFAADIYDKQTGKTGVVGANALVSTTPLPATLPLMASVLFGGGLWLRRRRAQQA